jgi:hypothetical protein
MEERWVNLSAYEISLPTFGSEFLVGLLQWSALLILAAVMLWMMNLLFSRYSASKTERISGSEDSN